MNLIDISSYQGGMNLSTMFNKNSTLDGVIVKVSQGTGYINPEAKNWLDWLTSHKKPTGTYHYLDTYGAVAEAQHYVNSVSPWLGKVALAIDYEENTLSKGTLYLKACLDEVYKLTGIKPLIYCSQVQTLQAQDFREIAAAGYPLWVAQYADMNPVHGFIDFPWSSGTSAPFPKYTMRQYTSNGYLQGYSNNLDFDLFYGTRDDWDALTSKSSQPVPAFKPADPVIVAEVLSNRYGIGTERITKLREAGYDPTSVQQKINQLYLIASNVKKAVGSETAYYNSIIKLAKL